MKKIAIITALLSQFFSLNVFAYFLVFSPNEAKSVSNLKIGGYYFFEVKGNIFKVLVTKTEVLQDQSVRVDFSRPDQTVYIDFDEEPEQILANEPSQVNAETDYFSAKGQSSESSQAGASQIGEGDVSFSAGVGAGALQGIGVKIIEDSGVLDRIHRAEDAVEKYKQENAKLFQDVSNQNIAVSIKQKNVEILSEPSALLSFNAETFRGAPVEKPIDEIKNHAFISSFDESANKQLVTIQNRLVNSRCDNPVKVRFRDISWGLTKMADTEFFFENRERAEHLLKLATAAADVLTAVNPLTSVPRSLYELAVGKNLFTGAEVSDYEQVMNLVNVALFGEFESINMAYEAMSPMIKAVGARAEQTMSYMKDFIRKTGNAGEFVLKEGSEVRRINLRPATDPAWGLTRKHLNKHFFGESKFALKNIDPAGNPDKWMKNISELAQSQNVVARYPNGVFDVVGSFSKTNSQEVYNMGLRLYKNEQGTFDVVTVLTDQTRF